MTPAAPNISSSAHPDLVQIVGMVILNRLRSLHRISYRCVLILIGLAGFGVATVHPEINRVALTDNAATGLPRVVVLADDADLEALLVVNFSGVEILERKELPRVSSEQLLAGGDLRLAGADIALVVDRADGGGVLRVVDCKTGAVIVVLEMPTMPVAEAARWLAVRARPFLNLATDVDRPRVSLAGLRFVTDSAENRAAERALNLVLAARLQAGGAVVLERWRMGDLVFEKTLDADESPFWNAARLVDGSVDAKHGRLSSRVRVRDAAGAETLWELTAESAEELAEAITARILRPTEDETATNGASSGSSRAEAEAFLAEARWMLAHGLPREAWQATESALALGITARREAEMLRVQAAAMCAYPDDLRRPHTTDGGYERDAIPREGMSARLSAATEAMWMAGDYWNAYPTPKPPEWWTIEHPANLTVYSLYTGLRLLRAADDHETAPATDAEVAGLRAAIRRNVDLLKAGDTGRLQPVLYCYLANYAGYWPESLEEAVDFYRTILAPDFFGENTTWREQLRRDLGFGDLPRPPFLVGTAPPEDFTFGIGSRRLPGNDDRARIAWASFLDELSRSPHVLNRADALALRWRSTADYRGRLRLTSEIVDFVSANLDALAGPHGPASFKQLIRPLREVNRSADLADAQEKLVNVFLAMIRPEEQLPSSIWGYVWVPFTDGKINAREEQARALLDALAERRTRPSTPVREQAAIDSARSSLLREFPSLRPAINLANEDALPVRSLWLAAEHKPEALRGRTVGFDAATMVWHRGALWAFASSGGGLWKIDPASGVASVLPSENRPDSFSRQLVGWGDRFVLMSGRGVWVRSEQQTRWEKLDLPKAHYRLAVARGDLWAASGEDAPRAQAKKVEGSALYRITPSLAFELAGSSRRRPAAHPLDLVQGGVPFSLSPAREQGVVIGVWGRKDSFIESDSGLPPGRPNEKFIGNLQISSTPGLIIRTKHRGGSRHALVRAEFLDAGDDELLLSHPEFGRPERARFPYPPELDTLPASSYAAAWSDDGIEVFAWASHGSPWGASTAWIVRIDATGGSVIPLRFVWPADGDDRARASGHGSSNTLRYPMPEPEGLIATDDGLVITGRAMLGFWFIPKEELEARRLTVRAAKAKSRAE